MAQVRLVISCESACAPKVEEWLDRQGFSWGIDNGRYFVSCDVTDLETDPALAFLEEVE